MYHNFITSLLFIIHLLYTEKYKVEDVHNKFCKILPVVVVGMLWLAVSIKGINPEFRAL
jgi:membrane protein CcdC involved in cytochrome C biogenesis